MKKKNKNDIQKNDISFRTISSNDIYRILFKESREGIVLIDANLGQIIDANPEFERQTGRTISELQKLKIWQIRPLNKRIKAKELFYQIRENGIGRSTELDILKPDSSITKIDFLSKLIVIDNQEYLISISRDITEIKTIEGQMRDQQVLLQKQKDELESFSETVAHDIRGKLQIISMFNELMSDSIYSERIQDQVKDMNNFIENLLLLAKEGEILGSTQDVDLNELIGSLITQLSHLDSTLIFEYRKLPVIKGDKTKLNQVFENLFLNIIKHAKATNVHISSEESNNQVKITIADNGKGMTAEEVEDMFSSVKLKKYKSLGLQIVKKIVEAHKGSFDIQSVENKGTTIILSFPN